MTYIYLMLTHRLQPTASPPTVEAQTAAIAAAAAAKESSVGAAGTTAATTPAAVASTDTGAPRLETDQRKQRPMKKKKSELYTKDEDLEKVKSFAKNHGCTIS